MNELDDRIQAALNAATELPDSIPEPTLSEEILSTFSGPHRGILVLTAIKMAVVGILTYFCMYQFFQQETMMAMIAYASATIICVVSAGCMLLFLWVDLNHKATQRQLKRLELHLSMINRQLQEARQSEESVS